MEFGKSKPMTRRHALALMAGTGLALGLNRRAGATEGKVLRIGHPQHDPRWSPLRGNGPAYRWNSLWWAAPLRLDGDGTIQPYVVSSWAADSNWTLWKFKINPAASFSDGSRLTANEVRASWDLACRPDTQNARIEQVLGGVAGFEDMRAGTTSNLAGVTVTSDIDIEVLLTRPDPIFYMRLANHIAPIVPPGAMDGERRERPDWWLPAPGLVVSGPFRPAALDEARRVLILERNDNFFGPRPRIDRIEVEEVADTNEAIARLKAGTLDAHTELSVPRLEEILGRGFVDGPIIPKGQHFWFNVNRVPTDDINVRKALVMAVDRDRLMQVTFPNGPHKRADQILNAVTGVIPNFIDYPFDPGEARRAMAQSRYAQGSALPDLVMAGISNPAAEAAAQFIAGQWRQNLGVTRVTMLADTDQLAPEQRGVQIFRDDVGTRVPDAVLYLKAAIASDSTNARVKMGGYLNPAVDAALADGAGLAQVNPGRDFQARRAMALFREDWAYLPWYYEAMSRMAMPWVTGFEKNADWQVSRPWEIDIAR